MQETQVQSQGQEDPLEGMATHSSILARRIRGAWQATICGVSKSQTQLRDSAYTQHKSGIRPFTACLESLLYAVPAFCLSSGDHNTWHKMF